MVSAIRIFINKPLTYFQALLWGTIAVGTLDILDAIVFFWLKGVAPIRIFQSIASGILGRAAFGGGFSTALLGGILHYFISFSVVAVFCVACRWLSFLWRRPFICGVLYGLVVYAVMNLMVVPLSAANSGKPTLPVLINGLLIHMLGVGLPSALFARAVWQHRM
jgi:hypothetical protein